MLLHTQLGPDRAACLSLSVRMLALARLSMAKRVLLKLTLHQAVLIALLLQNLTLPLKNLLFFV